MNLTSPRQLLEPVLVDALSGPVRPPAAAPEATSIETNISLAPTVSVETLGKKDDRLLFDAAARPAASSSARRPNGLPHTVLLRLDPSLLLRKTEEEPRPPPPPPDATDKSVRTLDGSLKEDLIGAEQRWSEELSRLTSREELDRAKQLARELNPAEWERIFLCFAEVLQQALRDRPRKLRSRDLALPATWHEDPWYLLDPRTFYAGGNATGASFQDTARGLEYLRRLGFENVAFLPHYEADGLGGSSGVVAHSPARELGGPTAFSRLVEHAARIGLRLATSAPIAAVSLQHKWFEGALSGDTSHLALFRRVDGAKLLGESIQDGRLFVRYGLPSGVIYEEPIHDPEILPHDHRILATTATGEVAFHRSRYPWEVDLDLGSPGLFRHVLTWVAGELNQGVLGKVFDDVVRWFEPVSGAPRVHAMLGLIKLFARVLSPKEVLIPIVALPSEDAAQFSGRLIELRRSVVSSEGDLFAWHRAAVALRESLCLTDKEPLEHAVIELSRLELPVPPLAWLEHHDELELDLTTSEAHRRALVELTLARGGALARNGDALVGRLADALDHDPRRIALAIFCLYMLPAVPLIYQGTELGASSAPEHASAISARRLQSLAALDSRIAPDRTHDPVLVHRGPILAAEATRRFRERSAPTATLTALNALRQKRPALRGRAITFLSTGLRGVVAWAKKSCAPGEVDRTPIVLIANLAGQRTQVALDVGELRAAFRLASGRPLELIDVLAPMLGDTPRDRGAPASTAVSAVSAEDHLLVALQPHGFAMLEVARAAPTRSVSSLRARRF